MRFSFFILFAFSLLLFQGCATVFKGYYSSVELENAPDSLQVFTADGVELPVTKAPVRVQSGYSGLYDTRFPVYADTLVSFVALRSKYDYVLILKHAGQERRVLAYGKIGAGWLALNTVLGLLPAAVDALTGDWNYFAPINAKF